MSQPLRAGLILLALVSAAIPGCQGEGKKATVSGEVTLDNQPLKEGAIRFVPVAGDTPTSGGEIRDGKFTAQVPVGNHKVEISASKVVGKRKVYEGAPDSPLVDDVVELLPARYNYKTELTIEVKSGNQTVRYDLKGK